LSAAAEASKGDFEQAEANYATTVGSSLPQQIQKAELDATSARSNFEAQQKVYESRKELFQQGALPRRDLDSAEVAFFRRAARTSKRKNNLPTCSALERASAQIRSRLTLLGRRPNAWRASAAQLFANH